MTQRTPFKFLDAYTQADRDIFCGRDADIEELHARALQNRLLLVYGPSGVGKTSLIQCGLMNKFPAADRLPLTVRYGGNLFAALDRAIAALTKTPIQPEASLTEKLQTLYFDYFTPITLIFDQLEELFIFGAAEERERFGAEIAALLDAPFKLRILFVIREEHLAELTAFEAQLPDLFANRLRVERMSHANVRRAIEEPCNACGVTVEEGLTEEIIARLGASKSGAVELTYLQVVLDKLYAHGLTRCAETDGDAVSLTLSDLKTLGDIGDILGAFLNEQLAALPREQAALGEAVLKTLVTPDGTKKALNAPEIADALPGMGQTGDQAEIAAILNHFVAVRLLSEKEESGRYELRHDSLAQKIFERMTALEKDLLEVMQLLENRCNEYHKRGTLLDAATLAYVAPYESRMRLNAAFADLILRSRSEVTRRRRRFMAAFVAAASAVFIIVSALGGLSYLKYREAEVQRDRALVEEQNAKTERQNAVRQTEIARSNEVEAMIHTANALLLSKTDDFGALFTGVKAGRQIDQVNIPINLRYQLMRTLQDALENIRETNRLSGHQGKVNGVVYDPSGTLIASAGSDGLIKIWQAADGREIATLQGHTDNVTDVAFSPDGKLLASSSWDKTIRVWQMPEGRELWILKGHKNQVSKVAFSPDGSLLASCDRGGVIRLWTVATGKKLRTLSEKIKADRIMDIAFSPDGAFLASSGRYRSEKWTTINSMIKLWSIPDGKQLRVLFNSTYPPNCLAFSPDGQWLAFGMMDGTTNIAQTADGKGLRTLQRSANEGKFKLLGAYSPTAIVSVMFSPDGKLLATGGQNGDITLWNVADDTESLSIQQHSNAVSCVAFSPDGTRLMSSGSDQTVKVWDIRKQESERIFTGTMSADAGVSFSPDNRLLASSNGFGGMTLRQVADGRVLRMLQDGMTDMPFSIAFSPDNRLIASGGADNNLRLRVVADGRKLHDFPRQSDTLTSVTFSPDGRIVAAGSWNKTITLWNVADGKALRTLEGHTDEVECVAFNSAGNVLASGGKDKTLNLWSAADGRILHSISGFADFVQEVAFSPDGTLLATGIADGSIVLYTTTDWQELRRFPKQVQGIDGLAFSPDGTLLASGDAYGNIKLWNVADGRELHIFQESTSPVRSVAFSADGKLLASASMDGTVKLWDMDMESLLTRSCAWLQGYVQNNSHLTDAERTLCVTQDIPNYQEQTTANPAHPTAWNDWGLALRSQGKLDEAIAAFRKQLEANPQHRDAWNNLGQAYWESGKLDEVLQAFQQQQTRYPEDRAAASAIDVIVMEMKQIGDNLLFSQKKQNEALAVYQKLVAVRPDHFDAWNKIGLIFYEQGKLDESLATYRKMVEMKPDHQDAWNMIGVIFDAQGKADDALTAFQKQVGVNPQHEIAWRNLGSSLWKLGKLDEAANAHGEGLKVNPKNIDLLSNDAELALVQGDSERCQTRIAAALPLVKSENQLFAILPFYQWLSNPAQGWNQVLTAIEQLDPAVKFTWSFDTSKPALERLDADTQKAAQEFIAFFEGKIDLPTLKARLSERQEGR